MPLQCNGHTQTQSSLGNREAVQFDLWDCGEINSGGFANTCFIGGGRAFHWYGVDFHKTTGSSSSWPVRPYLEKSTFRHCVFRSTTDSPTNAKGGASEARTAPGELGPEDRYADYTTERTTYLNNGNSTSFVLATARGPKNMFYGRCQFGGAGMFATTFLSEFAPQNPVAPSNPPAKESAYETFTYSGYENCFEFGSTSASLQLGGHHLFAKGNRRSGGAGAAIAVSTSYRSIKLYPGYDGPYYVEDTNSRPVPSSF